MRRRLWTPNGALALTLVEGAASLLLMEGNRVARIGSANFLSPPVYPAHAGLKVRSFRTAITVPSVCARSRHAGLVQGR